MGKIVEKISIIKIQGVRETIWGLLMLLGFNLACIKYD